MEPWILVSAVSLAFTIPALAPAYYSVLLFFSSLRYPHPVNGWDTPLSNYPKVSILIASYNEKFVVSRTLDALKDLDYSRDKLQVIVADDSTDETRGIIDSKLDELHKLGIETLVSRRENREDYKSGALNKAAGLLDGEYVLLLDADSTVTPQVLKRGLAALTSTPDTAFVSYRVGHYDREQNLTTRLFALTLDLGDTLNKMGSYAINAPFSFQGGFTLLSTRVLRQVGQWSNDTIVDDADLSCRIYESGYRGVYLSGTRIFSEDPPILEVWKKQAVRVAQGWTKCIRSNWKPILRTRKLSPWRRLALLLILLNPFSALSWIVVSFLSAFALLLGLSPPSNTIFTNPVYLLLISLPVTVYFAAAVYALHVQRIMTARNLALLPLISYVGYGFLTALALGFVNGIIGRTGSFFRTPKSGSDTSLARTQYFQALTLGRAAIVETTLSILAIILSVPMFLEGVWFLGLTLFGFGILTLKSIGLSRLLHPVGIAQADQSTRVEAMAEERLTVSN